MKLIWINRAHTLKVRNFLRVRFHTILLRSLSLFHYKAFRVAWTRKARVRVSRPVLNAVACNGISWLQSRPIDRENLNSKQKGSLYGILPRRAVLYPYRLFQWACLRVYFILYNKNVRRDIFKSRNIFRVHNLNNKYITW